VPIFNSITSESSLLALRWRSGVSEYQAMIGEVSVGRFFLRRFWTLEEVVADLRLMGCPVGLVGDAICVGWPGDRFTVEVRGLRDLRWTVSFVVT
jgi:hypothetical protein